MTDELVTHPAQGIYMPKFLAGILATILSTAMVGGFINLWQLNTKAIQFEEFRNSLLTDTASLPGALPRRDWEYEKEIISTELRNINEKLDSLTVKVEALQEDR